MNWLPDDIVRRLAVTGLFCAVTFLATAPGLSAQINVSSNPLRPQYLFPRIGAEIGGNISWQNGEYLTQCARFTAGSNPGVEVAAVYDLPLSSMFRLEMLGGLRTQSTSQTYSTTDPTVIDAGEEFVTRDVTYDHIGTARFTWLYGQPSLKVYLQQAVYVGAGPGIGTSIGSQVEYDREIITRAVILPDGSPTEVSWMPDESDDPAVRTYPSFEPENSPGILMDLAVFAGFEIRLNPRLYFTPRVTYRQPILDYVTDPSLSMPSLSATLGMRLDLK